MQAKNKKAFRVFLMAVFQFAVIFFAVFCAACHSAQSTGRPVFEETEGGEKPAIALSGLVSFNKKEFFIVQKPETQSRISCKIDKETSDKTAYKKLEPLEGSFITVKCKILESKNPFSRTIQLLSIEE